MEKPLNSKDSPFLERWSNAEIVNAKLGVTLITMAVISLSLIATLAYLISKPKPIYYVPSASEAGIAFSQETSKETVAIFSESWVLNWSNFTPVTVDEVYKHVEKFMSPNLLGRTRTRLKKDLEEVKKNNISSLFSVNQEPIVVEDRKGFNVFISGIKGIYLGKEEIKLQKMVYRLRLKTSPATEWNPYGLILEDISQEVIE
jgi:hypothetical protein